MAEPPNIAEVNCTPLRFQPGDRLLVRTFHRLDSNQRRKLAAMIRKWAGCEIEVFIYSSQDMQVNVERRTDIAVEAPAIQVP